MKTKLRVATLKDRALLEKLQALAERGVGGEKIVAQKKLARLMARLTFTEAYPADTPDLFSGRFGRSNTSRWIYTFSSNEFDVANSVKWAIESATRIPCIFQNGDLLAEASISAANRLTEIATYITRSFRALIERFAAIDGVSVKDRGVFVMGLYDGMMNEVRDAGQRLPSRAGATRLRKAKKKAVTAAPGLHIHPYTVALGLGKQIRFSAPLEQITAELDVVTRKHLT